MMVPLTMYILSCISMYLRVCNGLYIAEIVFVLMLIYFLDLHDQ